MKIEIGDTIYFSFKQNKPYSSSGIVQKIYGRGTKRRFDVKNESGQVFADEVTKVVPKED